MSEIVSFVTAEALARVESLIEEIKNSPSRTTIDNSGLRDELTQLISALDSEHDEENSNIREDIGDLREEIEALKDLIANQSPPDTDPPVTIPPVDLPPEPDPVPFPIPEAPPVWDGVDHPNPNNKNVIHNPDPEKHPEFTELLSHPGLVAAESFRPLNKDPLYASYYYGRIMHGGKSNYPKQHPRLVYDASVDAGKQLFVEGEKGLLSSYQSRIHWDPVSPSNAKSCTIRLEYMISQGGWRGGKKHQISTNRDNLHVELKAIGGNDPENPMGSDRWLRAPAVRVYGTSKIGGRGLNDLLVRGSPNKEDPDYCSGINKCPALPAMETWKRVSDIYTLEEHLSGVAWCWRPNVWSILEYTFDWNDPNNHKFWLHCKDKDTPRTLVIGLNGDGYPLRFTDDKTPILGYWLEYNNSSTSNATPSHIWVRNLVVLRDYDFK